MIIVIKVTKAERKETADKTSGKHGSNRTLDQSIKHISTNGDKRKKRKRNMNQIVIDKEKNDNKDIDRKQRVALNKTSNEKEMLDINGNNSINNVSETNNCNFLQDYYIDDDEPPLKRQRLNNYKSNTNTNTKGNTFETSTNASTIVSNDNSRTDTSSYIDCKNNKNGESKDTASKQKKTLHDMIMGDGPFTREKFHGYCRAIAFYLFVLGEDPLPLSPQDILTWFEKEEKKQNGASNQGSGDIDINSQFANAQKSTQNGTTNVYNITVNCNIKINISGNNF